MGSYLELEAERMIAARAVGLETGAFWVPAVLGVSKNEGYLEMEWAEGYVPLYDLACKRDPELSAIIALVGRALAAVHKGLRCKQRVPVRLAVVLPGSDSEGVFLHGDFSMLNVGYSTQIGKIVILDWSTAPCLKSLGNFGSKYLDLIWLASYMFRSAPLSRMHNWNAREMAGVLLRAYGAGVEFSWEEFKRAARMMEPSLLEATGGHLRRRDAAGTIRGLANWFMWMQWKAFTRRISFESPSVSGGIHFRSGDLRGGRV